MKRIAYLGWVVAALLTVYAALAFKAPQIERDIDGRSKDAVAAVANHPVAVSTDGRDVSVEGYADTDAEREKIIQAVRDVWGARGPRAEIEVLPRLAAYPFTVRLTENGGAQVSGAAPSVAEQAALVRRVNDAFGENASIDLELASGAPEDWAERLAPGLRILSTLDRGAFEAAGENLRLSGATRSESVLDAARADAIAAGEAQGMPWSLDLSLIKPSVSPFVLEADKRPGGAFAVSGYAPDVEARAAVAQATTDLALGVASSAELTLADGAPGPGWTGLAIRRMGALAALEQGRLAVSDFDATLRGRAATLDALFDAEDALYARDASSGEPAAGAVVFDVALAPYRLEAATDTDRKLTLEGAAPDAAAAAEIRSVALDLFGHDSAIRLAVASGASEGWTERARAALTALEQLDHGALSMVDDAVSLRGVSASEADLRDLERSIRDVEDDETPWETDLVFEPPLLSPFPLTVTKNLDGSAEIGGAAPDDDARRALARAARRLGALEKPADVAIARGASDGWAERALAAIPALAAVESGRIEIRDDAIALIGEVGTPEAMEAALASVRETLGEAASVEIAPRDPRRAPELRLTLDQASGVSLSGRAPEGLSPEEAASLLGLDTARVDAALETGGRGDAERWRAGLKDLGEFLPEFERVTVEIGEDDATLDGEILAASDLRQLRGFLRDGFGKALRAKVTVAPSETAYEDGATRVNVLTGRKEVRRGGFWLPEITVAEPQDCARASDLVLLDNTIRFIVASAELDIRARKLVNELSAIATECLGPNSPLALLIGGHTDSNGGDGYNMRLSERRAQAVLEALAARGVDPTAMQAVGYGETRPIGDNDTEEGRALNRRISFEWIDKTSVTEAEPPAGAPVSE